MLYIVGLNIISVFIRWADSTLWHQGALVKHCRELYKAEGITNAAEPGNQTHARFYVSAENVTS
jgi:hypothetical protein